MDDTTADIIIKDLENIIKKKDQEINYLRRRNQFLEDASKKVSIEQSDLNKAKELMSQLLDILICDKYVNSPCQCMCQWEE